MKSFHLIKEHGLNYIIEIRNKNYFEKDFFNPMNNAILRKTMEYTRNHRDIKHATTERRRDYLVSEPNYHTTKCFSQNLLAMDLEKNKSRNK